MNTLLIDNYDSFTYNLVQLLREAGVGKLRVVRNDEMDTGALNEFDRIVISPGPGLPTEAGITCELIRHFAGRKKIFGVCLGLQAIVETFGGKLYQPGEILHGESAAIKLQLPADPIFAGLEGGFEAGLYHSWAADPDSFPDCLRITARDKRGIIMAMRHKEYDICGVQFHPESIMTPQGMIIVKNWLEI